MKTDKTRNSVLNAITMILQTGVVSILSLISTNLILKNYGSDFNGVVATASQFINVLLIVEGGFSLAINVALFKPYVNNEKDKINAIMSAAKNIFIKIGLIFLLCGLILSLVYPLFIKSSLDYLTIFLIFMMVVSATGFNLLFVTKSQIMFQVSQREYKYTFFGTIINLIASLSTILLVYLHVNMLFVRLSILLYSIINGIMIMMLYRHDFKNISLKVKPDYEAIKGTKDIMIQKLTSIIYLTTPMIFISTFISTKMASVYAVYYSIYNIIKNFLSSMVSAPTNGFGQLLSSENRENSYKKYQIYEYIVIIAATILLSSVLSVIIPFISLYTRDVLDINYVNTTISILMAVILLLEIVHIPSGNIINVTGNFKVSKKIQIIACTVLVISLLIGGYLYGIYGILIGTIITNIVLAYMEISYTHRKIFNKSIYNFLKKLIINVIVIVLLVSIEKSLLNTLSSYLLFFLTGFIVFIINFIVVILVNIIFFKKDIISLKSLLIEMVKKFKK